MDGQKERPAGEPIWCTCTNLLLSIQECLDDTFKKKEKKRLSAHDSSKCIFFSVDTVWTLDAWDGGREEEEEEQSRLNQVYESFVCMRSRHKGDF